MFKIFLLLCLLLPLISKAQRLSNYRASKIEVRSDTIFLDSLSIIPGSLIIRDTAGNKLDSSRYSIYCPKAELVLDHAYRTQFTTLFVSYKVFPYNFSQSHKHKDAKDIQPDAKGNYNPFTYTYNQSSDIFKFGGLNKNGSISKGVSFGNNQDLVVNSNFNLQLSGKLNDDVEVLAAITDNNIPIQPDGNTQQIQDFDKVFIQLSSKSSKLIAGDFELTRPDSYFMNYNKKTEGGDFSTTFNITDSKGKKTSDMMTVYVAGGISKGKYAKNQFAGTDGNQGPYVLTGAQNEPYIVVLSGTESVYIDGVLMVRGQENDYIINYNTAQIIFTAKRQITKDSRISVEFEYTNQNYATSLFAGGFDYITKKTITRFNFYSEQDIKSQPLQQTLSDSMKLILAHAGDSLDKAVYSYVDSVAFTNTEVLYKKIRDTVGTTVYYPVYVYSTSSDSAHFNVGFSLVGQGKGDYVQIQSAANGRVFKWLAPIGGVPQGNYAPVTQLIPPKKKQMITLSTDYAISKRTKATVEVAMSNNDINLFSTLDKNTDVGYAVHAGIKNTTPLNRDDTTKWNLITEFNNEYTSKYFSPIDRYRDVEFERDWNLTSLTQSMDENITSLKFSLSDSKKNFTSYQFQSFLASPQYTGFRNSLNGNLEDKGFHLIFNGSILDSKDNVNTTRFIRSDADLSKKLGWITVGVDGDQEYNSFKSIKTDSLQKNSFSYTEWGAYISNSDTMKNKYTLFYKTRVDYLPLKNSLALATTAQNIGVTFNLLKSAKSKLTLNGTYRNLEVNDTSLTTQQKDKSLLGRIEYSLKVLKGAIYSSTFYEIGSGLVVKQQYSYIQVAMGQGTYVWNDYNGDGIMQLNEFELATIPGTGNYIRVYTPTNQYVKTYTDQFSQTLNINPSVIWNSKKGIKKFISRLSDQTTYSINNKNNDNNDFEAYNPFHAKIGDSSLISVNSNFRNSFYFNRSSSKFGFDFDYINNRIKELLVDGFDSRTSTSKEINIKWGITKAISLTAKNEIDEKTSTSAYCNTNDYDVISYETQPTISFQPNVTYRISIDYKYSDKRNAIGNIGERAFLNEVGTEIKYNVLSKGSLLLKVSYTQIKYNSDGNTPVAYEMLEGMKTGDNENWSISYQRNLSNNLQLNLSYDGRKSEGAKIINVGNVQLRAYF
ncbi:MAG: hypothetical protein ABR968_02400 [Bacteroidales bacterium]